MGTAEKIGLVDATNSTGPLQPSKAMSGYPKQRKTKTFG